MAPAVDDRPKLIYFAERPPELDRDGFMRRWRQHARLGMAMPRWKNISRYVHCDAVDGPGLGLPIARCDGVAILWYRSEKARLAHISDRSAGPVLRRDEMETFARPVREVSILTDAYVFRPPAEESPLKLFLRVWGRPEHPRRAFRRWWLQEFGPRLLQRFDEGDLGCGYIQNHSRASNPGKDALALCDCVDEIACADAERCDAAIQATLAGIPDAAGRITDIEAIWTEETVLFDCRGDGC